MKKRVITWVIGLLVLSSIAVGVAIAASDTPATDVEAVGAPQIAVVDSAAIDGVGGAGGAAGGAGGGATGGGGADVNVAQY